MQNISVIGAGTMGNGIAHLFAQYGFRVNLVDTQAAQLDKAIQAITRNMDRQVAKGTLTEKEKQAALWRLISTHQHMAGRRPGSRTGRRGRHREHGSQAQSIFRQLDEAAPAGCILASNTSSIPITKIAAATKRPRSVIGMHFMNPVPVMRLVEIINGYATDPAVTRQVVDLSIKLGKEPLRGKRLPRLYRQPHPDAHDQ